MRPNNFVSRLSTWLVLAPHFLCIFSVDASLFDRYAFVGSPPQSSSRRVARSSASLPSVHALKYETNHDEGVPEEIRNHIGLSRREVFRSSALVGVASIVRPSLARAAATDTVTKTSSTAPSRVVSNTLCDPSVSTWVKTYDDNTLRTVHILGTAHISSSSAELAGQMVREIKPNVVFVELDAKRVARAIPGGIKNNGSSGTTNAGSESAVTGGGASASAAQSGMDAPGAEEPTTTTTTASASKSSSAFTSTPNDASNTPQRSNPFDVQSKLVNVGSKYVGNAVKGMYGKLESEGFKAGDEFAMSVKEGLAIGSTIVLGDRDVEVTLKRLTQALAKTDIRKLLSADSEVNSSMEELLPEGMKNQMKQSSNGGGGSSITTMGLDDVAVDKGEFQTFVETMKAKENVKKIMKGLQSTAPEIYEAMVAERDVYMARGLDELGLNLKDKNAENTVAVMGMAHVDGVERYLASKGWKEMSYPCPVVR